MNGIKSINNERAKFAYEELQKISKDSKGKSKFRSLARSFPTMVQVNGLTAAVAFLFSKKDPEHKAIYGIIYRWLKSPECICKCEESDLMCYVINIDSKKLQLATTEVMALLVWVKRFAEGMFSDE